MKVSFVPNEPTTFVVEGRTLICTNAKLDRSLGCRFVAKPGRKRALAAGDKCPKCQDGLLVPREHLVEISAYDANGKCACEWFDFNLRPQVEAMSFLQRMEVRLRCEHIEAARDFALDRQLLDFAKSNRINEHQTT